MGPDERIRVGLVYNLPLHEFIGAHPDLVEIVEIEPQILWFSRPEGFVPDIERLDRVSRLAPAVCAHGVGLPVGTARPAVDSFDLFAASVARVGAAWASEHLSFSRAAVDGRVQDAGFLLPPCPTEAGICSAIAAIAEMKSRLPVPFAVENGVSYLRPGPGEPPDGEWLRAVLEGADCGLVLDLHNAWCNDRNGRQRIEDFLAALPLERVIELHFAGGLRQGGYWLDGHAGASPPELFRIARALLPDLPGLRGILFEVTASAVDGLGELGLARELERLHALRAAARPGPAPAPGPPRPAPAGDSAAWEDALLAAIRGAPRAEEDPGLGVYRELIRELRRSNLSGSLPYTARWLAMTLGREGFIARIDALLDEAPVSAVGPVEAERVGAGLLELQDPGLSAVLRYDLAVLRALTGQQEGEVRAEVALLPLLLSLAENRPPTLITGPSIARVGPRGVRFFDSVGLGVGSFLW